MHTNNHNVTDRTILTELQSVVPGIGRNMVAADPKGVAVNALTAGGGKPGFTIVKGVVRRASGPLSDYSVDIGQGSPLKCVKSTTLSSRYFGSAVSDTVLEGTDVLVFVTEAKPEEGIIIGAVPTDPIIQDKVPVSQLPRTSFESGTALDDGWLEALLHDPSVAKIIATYGRPMDTLPGEHTVSDLLYGGRITQSGPVAEIAGGPLAKVRVSGIDDRVDIQADTLMVAAATGDSATYDDGGFTSQEEEVSVYKHERLGEEDGEGGEFPNQKSDVTKGFLSKFKKKITSLCGIPRLRVFKGYLGSVFHAIVSIPGKNANDRDKDNDDIGVCSFRVGKEGRVTLTTSAGISLIMTNKVPVPKRKRFPWDPKGTKACDVDMSSSKKGPYTYQEKAEPGVSQLRSAEAYRSAQAYEPFDKMKDDFDLPDGDKIKSGGKDEEVDKTSGTTYDYGKEDNFATFTVEPDGTVIFGGGSGCELVMSKGKITMAAPNGIFMSSGKDIIQLAGNDVVSKAVKGIEMSSTSGDVRIKAEKNLHAVASGTSGSVVIQSNGAGAVSVDGIGRDVTGSGIALICKEGGIAAVSKTSTNYAEDKIESVTKSTVAKSDRVQVDTTNMTFTTGSAMINLANSYIQIGGNGGILIAGTNTSLWSGTKTLFDWKEVEGDVKPYEGVGEYAEDMKLPEGYTDDLLEDVKGFKVSFLGTYDTSLTDKLTEPGWSIDKKLYKYEPKEGDLEDVLGEDDDKTYSWPGKDVKFIRIKDLKNTDGSTRRSGVKVEDGKVEAVEFSKFPVLESKNKNE